MPACHREATRFRLYSVDPNGGNVMNRIVTVFVCAVLTACSMNLPAAERATVAIIGTGDLGGSVGPKLAEAGYQVIYGSRDPTRDSVRALVTRSGTGASATTQKEAAEEAEIILLAVPWPAMEQLGQNLGNLDGKIVIDATFPDQQADDGYLEDIFETSSAEMIQAWNPGARVVKTELASSYVIDDPTILGERVSSFVAADDREAKEIVAKLIAELGLVPVDAGPLRYAREIEAMVRLWYVPLLQGRREGWRFSVRPTTFWSCIWEDDLYEPVADADDLAQFPEPEAPPEPCSSHPPLR